MKHSFWPGPEVRDRLDADEHAGHIRAQEGCDRPGGVVALEILAPDIEHGADLTGVLRERDHVDDVVEARSGDLEEPADRVEDVARLGDEVTGCDDVHRVVERNLSRHDKEVAQASGGRRGQGGEPVETLGGERGPHPPCLPG